MNTHNLGFYEEMMKIIFQISSNTHLISSSDYFISFLVNQREVPNFEKGGNFIGYLTSLNK